MNARRRPPRFWRIRGQHPLTTGSKELAAYSGILDFTQRVYARVLPMDASLEACRCSGLEQPPIIIAMRWPFSGEMDRGRTAVFCRAPRGW
ncbi:MAG: precorrin-6A/cobalt-precorrin-6A reductase [Lachnospiraceae bacterium]